MGPHSFKCGKLEKLDSTTTIKIMLQWGRTLSSAERIVIAAPVNHSQVASMGPHSFKCGKVKLVCPDCKKEMSFNGAALFQVRKGHKPHMWF